MTNCDRNGEGKLLMRQVSWVSTTGGIFVLFSCGAFFISSFEYELGTLARMQAGLFPLIFSGIGCIIGIAMTLLGIFKGDIDDRFEAIPLRPLIFTLLAISSFALLIRWAGLLPAVFASTCLAGLGDARNSVFNLIALSISAAFVVCVIFVWALDLPFPIIKGII